MTSESAFVRDLAVLMAIAGGIAVLFSRLKWPKVIGYILVGVLIGSHTPGGSFLANPDSIGVIGQLGVVFLMFAMGLSFSARDMKRIRAVALPVALVDTLVMTWLGHTLGTRVFGWSSVPSFFLGLAMCDSATTLLAKVVGEMGWANKPFTKYALGTSVCEDILCVGMIAVATGFANGGGMSAGAFAASLGWLFVFFLAVLVFGFVLVPRLLKSVDRRRDDEALCLTMLGLCFFVSFIAYKCDFSLALGAFLIGIVGASSDVHGKVANLVEPLKTMFAAVFFVSIGLLVDPVVLWNHAPKILLVSAVIMGGKFVNILFASVATGLDVKTSVQCAMSLAQTGEFAFMVAVLYAGLTNNPESDVFPVAVGASLLTTLLNPFMVRSSDRVGDIIQSRIPSKAREFLAAYHSWLERISASEGALAFSKLKGDLVKLGVYIVLMIAVAASCSFLHRIDFSALSGVLESNDVIISFLLANFFSVSLLPLVLAASRSVGSDVAELLSGEGASSKWSSAFRQVVRSISAVSASAIFFVVWTMINVTIAPSGGWPALAVGGTIIVFGIVGWQLFINIGRRATERFFEALTAEERREGLARSTSVPAPHGDVHRFVLDGYSPVAGATIGSLGVRAKTGAMIVAVDRSGHMTRNVGPDWELEEGDTLFVLGNPSQLAALKDLLGVTA
ncbi:MAG: cation:proton antiporter [Kiritimatiellae bacterium]|nr:cation:proton antiporter [Kiritimatiellia bacterium]